MKNETSYGLFLRAVFGILGLTLLIITATISADTPDRIMAAVIGSAGICVAIFGAPIRKHANHRKAADEIEEIRTDGHS